MCHQPTSGLTCPGSCFVVTRFRSRPSFRSNSRCNAPAHRAEPAMISFPLACLGARQQSFALSRLKRGFDSPREPINQRLTSRSTRASTPVDLRVDLRRAKNLLHDLCVFCVDRRGQGNLRCAFSPRSPFDPRSIRPLASPGRLRAGDRNPARQNLCSATLQAGGKLDGCPRLASNTTQLLQQRRQ